MDKYNALLTKKRAEYQDKFSTEDLNQDFVKHYNSGDRVKVEFTYGDTKEVAFGTIGVTTGWVPVFLLMHNSRCIGSSRTIGHNARVLAVKQGGRYV